MTLPLVSVVMPVHNGGRFLLPALRSVQEQTVRDCEIIVVDDGSTDETRDVLRRSQTRDGRLRVVTLTKNEGHTGALVRGCALATGKFIARMDADDLAFPDRLERQVEALEREPDLAVVGSAIRFINQADTVVGRRRYPLEDEEIRRRLGEVPFSHPAVMMPRLSFERAGGYRPNFLHAEDQDLWLRLSEHGRLRNLSEVLLSCRLHPRKVTLISARRGVIFSLAAELSARARQDSGRDPFEEIEISEALVISHGATAQVIAERVMETSMILVTQGLVATDVVMARAALALAEQTLAQNPALAKQRHSAFEVAKARIDWLDRRPIAALVHVARAISHSPRTAPDLIHRALLRIRRRTPTLRG